MRYFERERERERDHIHITFITVYCYNCSILLLVVNILLWLIYKLNFNIGIGKNMVYVGFSIISSFRQLLRVLERIHLWLRGTTVFFCESFFQNKHLAILSGHSLLSSSHNWMLFSLDMYTSPTRDSPVKIKLTCFLHRILFYCFPKSCSLQF